MTFLLFFTLVGAKESRRTYARVIWHDSCISIMHTCDMTPSREGVMSHCRRSHVTLMHECEGVMSHLCMSHVTLPKESCHTYASYLCMTHVIYTWVVNSHIHTRTHTYTTACVCAARSGTNGIPSLFHAGWRWWVLSHLCMSHVIYIYESWTHTYMDSYMHNRMHRRCT